MVSLPIFELIVFSVTLAVVLSVSVPLSGTLVRYRASYNPRGLALDAEGGATPHTGPVVNSYFGMMKRVYNIEGWPGLYKGLMPTLLTASAIAIFVLLFLGSSSMGSTHKYNAPSAGIVGTFFYSVFYSIVSLPAVVITYRSIITPYRLPAFNPALALRVLLTPTERRRPWIIYLTPGLLASQVIHIAYVVLMLNVIRGLLLPEIPKPGSSLPEDIGWWRIAMYGIITLASTIILTPLEVISTRLAIQRNHASAEFNSVSQEVEGEEEFAEFYGDSEDVVGLRSERDPYLGLADTAKRIIDEEGVAALYRGWWVTMLGGLVKA